MARDRSLCIEGYGPLLSQGSTLVLGQGCREIFGDIISVRKWCRAVGSVMEVCSTGSKYSPNSGSLGAGTMRAMHTHKIAAIRDTDGPTAMGRCISFCSGLDRANAPGVLIVFLSPRRVLMHRPLGSYWKKNGRVGMQPPLAIMGFQLSISTHVLNTMFCSETKLKDVWGAHWPEQDRDS